MEYGLNMQGLNCIALGAEAGAVADDSGGQTADDCMPSGCNCVVGWFDVGRAEAAVVAVGAGAHAIALPGWPAAADDWVPAVEEDIFPPVVVDRQDTVSI